MDGTQPSSARHAQVSLGTERSYFLHSATEDPRCPAAIDACRQHRYLVPGDEVSVWQRQGAVACVTFESPSRAPVTGWLDARNLTRESDPPAPGIDAWIGHWSDEAHADIRITEIDAETIQVSGTATWGGNDPERVANGAVHVGEIEETRVHIGRRILRVVAGAGDSPPAREYTGACVIVMQRIREVLRVDDNRQCGGANVTFRGEYRRK